MSKEKSLKDHVANLKSTMITQVKMFMAIHNLQEIEFNNEVSMFQFDPIHPTEAVPCIAEYLAFERAGTTIEGSVLLKGRGDDSSFNWNIESCSVEEIAEVLDSLLEKNYKSSHLFFEGYNNPFVNTFNEKISKGLV
jgi:hypothetical protein